MLFFIKVEKNRMIPITSMEPMNAPIMTDRNPDKVNTPAVIVPAPASMTKATPKLAPELIPSMEGSAKGLLNVVCNISPDAASAIPQRREVMACGRRDSQTMKLQLAFSTSLPVSRTPFINSSQSISELPPFRGLDEIIRTFLAITLLLLFFEFH